jgi:hypothetical protein
MLQRTDVDIRKSGQNEIMLRCQIAPTASRQQRNTAGRNTEDPAHM